MQTRVAMMKSQKSSFMVKDILGLRNDDDFSPLKNEQLKDKCNGEFIIESHDEDMLEAKSCPAKGKFEELNALLSKLWEDMNGPEYVRGRYFFLSFGYTKVLEEYQSEI